MIANYFSQFASPVLWGVIPLIIIALAYPLFIITSISVKEISNRIRTLEGWFVGQLVSQLFSPLNKQAQKWALLYTTLAVYLLLLNLLGLLPYVFTPTTQLSINLALAVPLWLATVIIGMRKYPTRSLAHFLPEGTPPALIPMLVIIETVSLLIRPVALAVRLTANLTAGHLLIQLIGSATFALLPVIPVVSILAGSVLFLLTLLEVAVAIIQAFVFVLLLTLYLQENT